MERPNRAAILPYVQGCLRGLGGTRERPAVEAQDGNPFVSEPASCQLSSTVLTVFIYMHELRPKSGSGHVTVKSARAHARQKQLHC